MGKELTKQQKALLEYNRRYECGDFVKPEILDGKSVFDVLVMPEFEIIMVDCIKEQTELRKGYLQAIEELKKKGKYVPPTNRPVIDRVQESGLLADAGTFIVEFANVLSKSSKQPKEIRDYVKQLGMRAYNMTVEKFICEADPKMAKLYKQATEPIKN